MIASGFYSRLRPEDVLRSARIDDDGGVLYPGRLVAHVTRRGEFDQPLEYATHVEVFPPGEEPRLTAGHWFRFQSSALRDFERRARELGVT